MQPTLTVLTPESLAAFLSLQKIEAKKQCQFLFLDKYRQTSADVNTHFVSAS